MVKRVFIVRPFGTREGVDFDAVERELIQPAIASLQTTTLVGGTTLPIVEQGNIREDMFRELVTADVVVADLSIHNANVFYELGIRHAVRPHATFLLRAELSTYPFDLQTDRYFVYDPRKLADPGTRAELVAALVKALDATLSSARTDSPVYQLLPKLRPPDPAVLRVVPREFGEAVERAQQAGQRGDLRLLAHEARPFGWAPEGLRAVGVAQFLVNATAGAIETYEWLQELSEVDVETNQRLATLYQRMARDSPRADEYLAKSDAAIQRVIDSPEPGPWAMAEAYALKARNLKARWLTRFTGKTGVDAQIAALQAAELEGALEAYASGFAQDRNHFYSGLNALAMQRIRCDLATAQPDEWSGLFNSDREASQALEDAQNRASQFAIGVELAIAARQLALRRQVTPDREVKLWTDISAADLAFLTAARPTAVAQKYRNALADAPSFAVDSVRDQIKIFQGLGLRRAFVDAALGVTGDQAAVEQPKSTRRRVMLFTGHMIDAEGRREPRFPRTPAAEAEARRLIKDAIEKEQGLGDGELLGIAAGACGGDILFHEVCQELGIPTRLFLAVARERFSVESVQQGGPDWVERFDRLCERVPPRELGGDSIQLPPWLRGRPDYNVWQRNNLWMLFNALALDLPLTLIALWDEGVADGAGGTEDLVVQVRKRGHKVERLPAERLKSFTSV